MIDDKYSICNGVLEKIISEEFQLNIFSIEKNPDIENLKDIGKTLITNYMYNVPLIEILFISLNMKCCTKLFLYVIKFSSLIYLNGLSSILLYLAFIFNFQQAMHTNCIYKFEMQVFQWLTRPYKNTNFKKKKRILFLYCGVCFY